MTRLVLATRNVRKLSELERILADAGLAYELAGTDSFADLPDVAETGSTFAANALLKARAVSAHTGLPAVADDSGLCVDVLGGMPGILSARWAGRHGDDAANLQLVLDQIAELPDESRMARFVCAAAVAVPATDTAPRRERVVDGVLEGALVRIPRGTNGFGYDPIFRPVGHSRTTAEMDPDEKDRISHRGQALRALVPVLRELLG